MKMICPTCQGTGIVIVMSNSLSIAKEHMKELIDAAEKKRCPQCKGSGEVETGWVYQHLLKEGTIKE